MKPNLFRIIILPLLRRGLGGGVLLLPVAAFAQADLLVCGDKGYILTSTVNAAGASPVSYTWYENGGDMGSDYNTAAITVPAGKAPDTYTYARKASNDECPEGILSNTFTVVVLAQPAAPVINAPAEECQGIGSEVVGFTIAAAANTTYTWTGTSGSYFGDDPSRNVYVVSIATPGTIEVQATAAVYYEVGGMQKTCTSAPSEVARTVVHPLPVVTPASDMATCAGNTFTMTAEVVPPDAEIIWYSDATGDTSVGSGANYTTALQASATYYVGAVLAGCASASLTPVYAVVNLQGGVVNGVNNPAVTHGVFCDNSAVKLYATATGAQIDWYDAETGGTLLWTGNTYTTPTLSASATYYAQARYTVSGARSMRVPVTASLVSLPVVTQTGINVFCGSNISLSVEVSMPNTVITWYSDEAGNTPVGSGAYYVPAVTSIGTHTWYVGAVLTSVGCVSAGLTPVYAGVNLQGGVVNGVNNPAVTHGVFCDNSAATLYAAAPAGAETDWYDAETGGTLLWTGNTYTTPTLSASATYYAQARYTSGLRSMRVPVTASLVPLPVVTQTGINAFCGDDISLSVEVSMPNTAITWYSDVDGTMSVGAGADYTTTVTSIGTHTWYVGAVLDGYGCASAGLTPVYAGVNLQGGAIATVQNPAVVHGERCGTGTIDLSATPPAGAEILWYDADGTQVGTGNTFTTPTLSASATYYAQARYTVSGALSGRVPVTATVFLDAGDIGGKCD